MSMTIEVEEETGDEVYYVSLLFSSLISFGLYFF